jgi:paired amphipathic helix protein Sin3a
MFATIQILHRDDNTFEIDDLTAEAKWSYYVSSYTMRDPTEGIPMDMLRMPFLKRNLPPKVESEEEYNRRYLATEHHDGLVIRICTNTYHMIYEPGTSDWFVQDKKVRASARPEKTKTIHEKRTGRLNDKFVINTAWMKDKSREYVDSVKEEYRKWIELGPNRARAEMGEAEKQVEGVPDVQ